MKILGLDLGTTTGAAVLNEYGELEWVGRIDCGLKRYEDAAFRFVRFRAGISDLLGAWMPDFVAFEEVARHLGTDAAHAYGGFVAVLTVLCKERLVKYVGIPSATVKRTATGKGNADKGKVLVAAVAKWPAFAARVADLSGEKCLDEADALWVAEAARRYLKHER